MRRGQRTEDWDPGVPQEMHFLCFQIFALGSHSHLRNDRDV